jgi:hypothetical protein
MKCLSITKAVWAPNMHEVITNLGILVDHQYGSSALIINGSFACYKFLNKEKNRRDTGGGRKI